MPGRPRWVQPQLTRPFVGAPCRRRKRGAGSALFAPRPLLEQILYMCIHRRQRDTTYFLYFLLHRCVPGLNSPLVTFQSTDGRSTSTRCGPTCQVVARGSEAPEGRVRGDPQAPSARVPWAPVSITGRRPRGGRAFVKAKDRPRSPEAGQALDPCGRVCRAGRTRCHRCCRPGAQGCPGTGAEMPPEPAAPSLCSWLGAGQSQWGPRLSPEAAGALRSPQPPGHLSCPRPQGHTSTLCSRCLVAVAGRVSRL